MAQRDGYSHSRVLLNVNETTRCTPTFGRYSDYDAPLVVLIRMLNVAELCLGYVRFRAGK